MRFTHLLTGVMHMRYKVTMNLNLDTTKTYVLLNMAAVNFYIRITGLMHRIILKIIMPNRGKMDIFSYKGLLLKTDD